MSSPAICVWFRGDLCSRVEPRTSHMPITPTRCKPGVESQPSTPPYDRLCGSSSYCNAAIRPQASTNGGETVQYSWHVVHTVLYLRAENERQLDKLAQSRVVFLSMFRRRTDARCGHVHARGRTGCAQQADNCIVETEAESHVPRVPCDGIPRERCDAGLLRHRRKAPADPGERERDHHPFGVLRAWWMSRSVGGLGWGVRATR